MGRPPKHLELVEGHLTKEQKETRANGEKALTAKAKMQKSLEVKANKRASAHFDRLNKLYKEIGICDGLCENTINRYCLMLAKMAELVELSAKVAESMDELREGRGDMEADVYYDTLNKLGQNYVSLERATAKVRDQLLAIERENLLTIQGKLRAVPKQPEKAKAKVTSGYGAYRDRYGGDSG